MDEKHNKSKRLFGLLGRNLSHSFSQKYFREKFSKNNLPDDYQIFDVKDLSDFSEWLIEQFAKERADFNLPKLTGFNVTIPYKKAVLAILSELSDEANEVGAVNTVKIENGRLIGYNTDVWGFRKSLLSFISPDSNATSFFAEFKPTALVLGTGGASGAVCFVLNSLNIKYLLVSRTKNESPESLNSTISYDEINLKNIGLIVNTTPLGMFPENETCPKIPWDQVGPQHFLFDLVYNPEQTQFLLRGKEMGAKTQNGLDMLHFQAEKAWEIWN